MEVNIHIRIAKNGYIVAIFQDSQVQEWIYNDPSEVVKVLQEYLEQYNIMSFGNIIPEKK